MTTSTNTSDFCNIDDIDEFFYTPTSKGYPADICCAACQYRGNITLNKQYISKTKEYSNPNYCIITQKYKHLLRWLYLNPEAIKYINDRVAQLCCPNCDRTALYLARDSTYSLPSIMDSLECHSK